VLPVPAGSTQKRAYKFRYTSSLLDSVTAPKAAFARTTRLARTGAKVNSITDPDGLAIAFGYDASNRIITRRNKLGDTTYFQFDDGGALKQAKLSTARTEGAGAAITTNFRAAETRSVYSPTDLPTPLAKAYTQLDGSRVDVGDTTNFIVNRWGAPDTVTDALGQRTRITRGATFPALVTKMVMPNNFETRAYFNARALTDSTVAVNPYGTGANALTRFVWNPVWTHVDSVIGPMGERSRTFYRSTIPLVDSVRTGTNVLRRVKFTYTADNQVRSVTEPAGLPDSIAYDTLGNAKRTWTPLGRSASTPYFVEHFTDGIGRDTAVVHPISGDTTGKIRILFNAADQVIQTVDSGPPRHYTFYSGSPYTPDTSAITWLIKTDSSGYDAEGNLVYKRSISNPWSDAAITEQLKYDAAGRLRKRLIGSGPDSMVYDPAGNLVNAHYRSGLWVTQSYDALNRLVQQVVPERVYPSSRCTGYSAGPISGSGGCFMIFPYNPNAGDSLRLAINTAQFAYDTFGNITQANNRYARVTRTYFPGGALQSDTTAIGVYTSPLTDGTKRGQMYTYDLSGRRTSMQWYLGTTGYSYNDFGGLDIITDPNSNHYHIAYTLDGHVDSLVLGTGVTEKRGYDADGQLISKNRVSSYAGVGTLVTDALTYDRMNRVIHSVEQNHGAVPDETWITYDGLGAVISSEQASAYGTNIQEFRNDALGNVLYRRSQRTAGTNSAPFVNQYSPLGEMLTSFSHLSSPPGQQEVGDTLKQNFAGGGQLNREDRIVQDPNTGAVSLELASKHYYGADDKLMAVQRYMVLSNGSVRNGSWEEYWYDALGRRVLTRAARDSSKYDASISGPLCAYPSQCGSFKERVWWDGNQALVEERTPEGYTNDVSNSGLVGNIHGLTLDEPLAIITDQTRIVNYNWRGLGESSVFTNGQAGDNSLGNPATEIDWPAATQGETYFTAGPGSGGSGNPKRWMGTFVANGQGTTGMLYRRNRYFNPNGGQFTQADPLGIVGGMNAFGLAEGDPINFRDPFGVSPDTLEEVAVEQQSTEIPTAGSRKLCVDQSVSGDVQAINDEAIASGLPVIFNNAYRDQITAGTGGRPAAGSRSGHLAGFAFDINSGRMSASQLALFTTIAEGYGFSAVRGDPGHYQVTGGAAKVYGSYKAALSEARRSYAARECVDANVEASKGKSP